MGKLINMLKNNKKIVYIILILLLVIVVATGTIFIINSSNNKSADQSETKATTTIATAATLVLDAQKIIKTDPTKAKTILTQARQQYVELKNDNGISNVDSLLCLFDDTCAKK